MEFFCNEKIYLIKGWINLQIITQVFLTVLYFTSAAEMIDKIPSQLKNNK